MVKYFFGKEFVLGFVKKLPNFPWLEILKIYTLHKFLLLHV